MCLHYKLTITAGDELSLFSVRHSLLGAATSAAPSGVNPERFLLTAAIGVCGDEAVENLLI